ncbi:hypothetical protein PR048_011231 [Dryococelus australis]|uniref:Uncharacterized protein n=1 Tax=Dryococelus australis TaxID=614101 RepID=A0ABQ9HL69_9NEOP|nr:hypothetical protein PR048_011231 [Dryococelus australis]
MVSKALQKVTSVLHSSMDLVKSSERFLENMRSEECLSKFIMDAKELAEKNFSYEIEDEPVQAGRTLFKVNFFFVVLDTAVSSLKEMFELVENHSKSLKFLYDIDNLQTRDRKKLKDACTHLHSVLSDGEECDV